MYEEGISLRRKNLEGRRNKVEGRRKRAEEDEGEERWMRKSRSKEEGRSIRRAGCSYLPGRRSPLEGRSVCNTQCTCLPGRKKCLQNRV
jgi:hypothetical protein